MAKAGGGAHQYYATNGREPVVLLVEDEFLILTTLADHLRECGFSVLEVRSADEAINILSSDRTVDLVFSDIEMPGQLDGLGLARWMQANRPDVPLLLTSGQANRVQVARDLCDEKSFLIKPYTFENVIRHFEGKIRIRRDPD